MSDVVVAANRVYTALHPEPLQRAGLEIRSGRITKLLDGDELDVRRRSGEAIAEFGDATILPGLIDAHCHITLTGDGKTYEEQVRDPDEMMSLIAVSNLQKHLASGVTTIRDNGGRNRVTFVVREAVERGYISAPRMLLSGRPLTHSHGHFYWCNGVADSEAEIRAAVRSLVAEGADHIKIMASGGATAGNQPHYPSYTTGELRVAVETAHSLGRLTTAHTRATASMVNAIDAGMDCLEHASFQVPAPIVELSRGVAPRGTMQYDPEVTELMLRKNTNVSFTAQTGGYETLLRLRSLADSVGVSPEQHDQIAAIESYFEAKLDILRRLLVDGMKPRIAISTDAGPFDVSFGNISHGMELALLAGMKPFEVLDAVTRIPAEICGIDHLVGSISPDMEADLLVVEGDPLDDMKSMRKVAAVYQHGYRVV